MTVTTSRTEVVQIAYQAEHSRYAVTVDGRMAGFAEFRQSSAGVRAFIHTEIEARWRGRGLGARLIARALASSRVARLRVLPYCPYVRAHIAEHASELLDLVPEGRRAEFGLPLR